MLTVVMAHCIPDNIQLTHQYNKLIRTGKSNKALADFKASRDRSVWTAIDGKILDKPIQVYRMWYRYLQLALELEEKKVKVVTKMLSVPLKKPKKDQWGKLRHSEMKPQTKSVKVNRKAYAEWNLDIIPTTSFDHWWNGNTKKEVDAHKQLFYPERSVSFMKNKDDWIPNNDNYIYARIDNRRRVNDIISDFRMMLLKTARQPSSTSDYQVNGTPNINTLINRYNAFILQLTTTLQDDQMLLSPVFRKTQYGMGDIDFEEYAYSWSGSPGRAMRDLMLPSKIALLSVCDGYFVSNPNKDYINS